MSRDDIKKWILERRARLLVAAAASAGIALAAQGCEKKDEGPPPGPCLSMPVDEDAGPPPEPCLQPPPPEVCLSPQVCLEVVPPDEPPKRDGPFAEPPPGKS